MNRSVIIGIMIFGVVSQLVGLGLVRQIGSQLETPLRIALWAKRVSILLLLLSGGLASILTKIERPLDAVFIASLCAWIASTFSYWIVRLTISRQSTRKFFS
jgi:hypothetical protein